MKYSHVAYSGGRATPPIVATQCQAWLALDDKNYTGAALQHRFAMLMDFSCHCCRKWGPTRQGSGRLHLHQWVMNLRPTKFFRELLDKFFRNSPKVGLKRFFSTAGTWDTGMPPPSSARATIIFFSGLPTYGRCTTRGRLEGDDAPARPSNPDPKKISMSRPMSVVGSTFQLLVIPLKSQRPRGILNTTPGLKWPSCKSGPTRPSTPVTQSMRRLFVERRRQASATRQGRRRC